MSKRRRTPRAHHPAILSTWAALVFSIGGSVAQAQTPQKQPAKLKARRGFGVARLKKIPPRRFRPRAAPAQNSRRPSCTGLETLAKVKENRFAIGESLDYEMKAAGAFVGRFELKVGAPRSIKGKKMIPLFARARTNGFVSALQKFEGRYMALADPKSLDPIGVRVESTYNNGPHWERITFSENQKDVSADFLFMGKQKSRKYKGSHRLTDLLTMLYVARQIRVEDNMTACQDVFGARRLWRMNAKVVGIEKVSTPAGRKPAYKVHATFDRRPTPGLNNRKRPKFAVNMYFSTDDNRVPYRFDIITGPVVASAHLKRWSVDKTLASKGWDF